MEKYEGHFFDCILRFCAHTHTCVLARLASPRQDNPRPGRPSMAWHGLVWCACVLSYDRLTSKLLPPKLVREVFLKSSLKLRLG